MQYHFKIIAAVIVIVFLKVEICFSQVEFVDVAHPVYNFLKRMQLMKIIPDYNSSNLPISRREVSSYLTAIRNDERFLTGTDRKFLRDYEIEFEFDMTAQTNYQSSLFGKRGFKDFFNDNLQKHVYFYTDSAKTFFADIYGKFSQRGSNGDSIGKNSFALGEAGFSVRGTFHNSVAYFLKLSNGQTLHGNDSDLIFASITDKIIFSDREFLETKSYTSFEGYLRYMTKTNWLSLTFGRTQLKNGFGYVDKLFLSDNAAPFDFGRIDLKYKSVRYSFTYGSINGDSVSRPLSSKNIATHLLNVDFSSAFRIGFWESVIISDQPFSFTYLNPVSFLTSADLSIGKEQTTENNALMGIDMEFIPAKNLSLQTSLLIDDLNFATLGKDDSLNENKFGWQAGLMWTSNLNMNLTLEFTHLDPFVYSHRSNKSTYTNRSLPLGHLLPPNSDEIAFNIGYDISNRLRCDFLYRHQRHGEGIITDSAGNLIANYGGNINFGLGDAYLRTNGFLDGTRINSDIFTAAVCWQPVKQFYFDGKFQYRHTKNITEGIVYDDSYYFAEFRLEF